MLAQIAAEGRPPVWAGTPADARARLAATQAALGPGPEVGSITEIAIPTRSGSVPARLVTPLDPPIGLIVYLHGGGWVVGTLDDFGSLIRLIALASGCAVLAPDYRLAPEHPFPAGLEDCEDALLYASVNREALCGARLPLVLAGDSAGANLATVAARWLRGRVDPDFQALIYPVVDADFDRASYHELSEGMPLTRADVSWFFDHYVPVERRRDPDVSPIRAADLSGSPPTLIITAEYDVLRDEGEEYAAKLAAAGTSVTLRRIAGLTHGFARLHGPVDAADAAIRDFAGDIAAACRKLRPAP